MKAIIILLSLLLPLILILNAISNVAFDLDFYLREQQMLEISEPEKTKQVVSYLDTGKPALDFLSQKEEEHMKDVRKLVVTGRISLIILMSLAFAGLLLLIYLESSNSVKSILFSLFGASIIGFIILFAFFFFTFDTSFVTFHNVFFEQGSWTFDESSTLIQLFPIRFFLDATIKILFNYSMSLVLFITTTIILAVCQKSIYKGVV